MSLITIKCSRQIWFLCGWCSNYDESLSMHLCSSFFEIHILLVQSCDGPVSVLSQRVVDYLRAVNLPRHQTLRIDRWRHIAQQMMSLICAKNAHWFRLTYIAHKQFIYLATLLLKLQWHTRIYWEMFYVYSSSNIAIIWNFMVGKSILQEMATLVISRETSDSSLETGRCSPKSGVSQIIRESWQHCFLWVTCGSHVTLFTEI